MIKQLQLDLQRCARMLYQQHMQLSDGGNISLRLEGRHMLIKASKSSFSTATYKDFVIADFNGNLIEGERTPSKEGPLHGAIYRRFTDAGAVVHCHSPFATACSLALEQLPFSTYHSEVKLKLPVKVYDTGSYAVLPKDAELIVNHYEPNSSSVAFLLKSHGMVAVGTDLAQAQNIAELIEETAKIFILGGLCNSMNGIRAE